LVTALDRWLYFLRHAEKMDPEALPERLQHPLLARALEELKNMNQTDIERERYEARRKWQLDYNSGLSAARREGEQKGREEGRQEGRQEGRKVELIASIHFCQRLLGRSQSPTEELTRSSLED